LVIIGLVVGGLLTGQTLIHSAALRSQIKQIQDYDTAYNTFVLKYNCIPGDCANATTLFGTTDPLGNPITNGDGNGLIQGNAAGVIEPYAYGERWQDGEWVGTLQELALSKMIAFSPSSTTSGAIGQGHPALALNSSAGFFIAATTNFCCGITNMTPYGSGDNMIFMVDANSAAGGRMNTWDAYGAIFTPSDLQAIDTKIDDGAPFSGHFLGYGSEYGPNNNCVSNPYISTPTYALSYNTAQCIAAYVIN